MPVKSPPKNFAQKLKLERIRIGKTQGQVAKIFGVSLHTVCKWEKGKSALELTQEAALGRLTKIKSARS